MNEQFENEAAADLLTAAQMRAAERAAIDGGTATGRSLMERAGQGVARAIREAAPALDRPGSRADIFCGPGNNGGDGYVVARLLHERGWQVRVFGMGAAEKMPPDARANRELWEARGETRPLDAGAGEGDADLVVDALFGTGLSRPVADDISGPVAAAAAGPRRPLVVAVDMPSGLCADSGRVLGAPVAADLTVTFHAAKLGHYLAEGPEHCGRLRLVDIGLPGGAPGKSGDVARRAGPPRVAKAGGHKYSHGHALVLSGGAGRTGAARLAARAALRTGAGLVTLGVPPAAQLEAAAQLTAVMLARVPDAEALTDRLADERLNALCLGPGLGTGEAQRAVVAAALAARRATVLDADAITLWQETPGDLFAALHEGCVLTPHFGEFRRLFPDLAETLTGAPREGPAPSRVDAARAAAARAGCTVLLKGADTVIAAPDGRAAVSAAAYGRAVPWLATAGAGDVLSGIVTGLLARDHSAFEAARDAAWLHVEAARTFGPGLIAEDLPETLPAVFRALGA